MCRTASIPPRERRLRRKICSEINGCYREAFNRRSDSIIHVFLLSIFRGEPLINNLDSCPLIFKDVWLYNKVGSGAFYVFPSQCQNLLGSVQSSVHKSRRIDGVDGGGGAAPCQSHPTIPHAPVRVSHPRFSFLPSFVSPQATRSRRACRRAASAEAPAPPCARAATTSWTAGGKGSPPSQPTCQRAWPRCKFSAAARPRKENRRRVVNCSIAKALWGFLCGFINQDLPSDRREKAQGELGAGPVHI